MPRTLPDPTAERPRAIPEKSAGQLKANLRKTETEDSWLEIGECLDEARRVVGWTIDELAAHMPPPKGSEKRDAGQVQRWIQGKEQMQLGVAFAVEELRAPLVIALARLAIECEETTVLSFKRRG